MRPRWLSFALAPSLALALAVATAVSGRAAASPIALGGSISVVAGTLPPIVIPVTPALGDLTGGTLTVPAGIASVSGLFVPITGFPLNLLTGIVVTASNGAGSFSVPGPVDAGFASVQGGGFGGKMPILGVAQLKGALAINVPLSVAGSGGVVNAGGVQLEGAPWTTGVAKVALTNPTLATFAAAGSMAGPLGAVSSTVTLVSPARVDAGGILQLPLFATWSLHWIPEPGTAVLFGAGLVALVALGRRRTRP